MVQKRMWKENESIKWEMYETTEYREYAYTDKGTKANKMKER